MEVKVNIKMEEVLVEQEVKTYLLELTELQAVELMALLGHCSTPDMKESIYYALEAQKLGKHKDFEELSAKHEKYFLGVVPQLKYI